MRFIHTSDWHLGRYLRGVSLLDDQRELLLDEFLPLVRDEGAEAVIIAGDVYDRGVPPAAAVELFDEVLQRLNEAGVKVIYIAGNHDSAARIDFGHGLLSRAGVYVRGRLDGPQLPPYVLEDEYGPVYVALYPYVEPSQVRLAFQGTMPDEELHKLGFVEANALMVQAGRQGISAGARSIAVAHGFIAGSQTAGSETTLLVGGADQVAPSVYEGFSYTALGHIHRPQRAGAENIRYSGSLMKYSFDEWKDEKGVLICDMDAQGQVGIKACPLAAPHDVQVVEGSLEDILHDRERYPASDAYTAVKLTDTQGGLGLRERLRSVYPNILELSLNVRTEHQSLEFTGQEMAHRSAFDVFGDFYQHTRGKAMSPAQQEFIKSVMHDLQKEEGQEA